MKILTTNLNKGGVRKTTFSHNFAEWLALHGNRCLILDTDDSRNLTLRYLEEPIAYEHTVVSLFEKQEVSPVKVKENIDLIAGSKEVAHLKQRLISVRQRELIFFKWLEKNYEMLQAQYDYIIIDTENDEGILTLNALIVSDVVVGITDTSMDGYEALLELRELVHELNRDFDNEAEVLFIAGGISPGERSKDQEKSTRELLEVLEPEAEYVGAFKRKTAMATTETMFEQAKNSVRFASEHRVFIENLEKLFSSVKEVLDNV
ncbi:ParA family protein [Lactococcus petauri]|uniref:ParA family protein n=1 Tax=Lactococcus petauri TaxID=1940789 RepID=UPI001F594B35|nr:AAA family ATPase [Lactococcus petauri]